MTWLITYMPVCIFSVSDAVLLAPFRMACR
jgi:hypothetical protein